MRFHDDTFTLALAFLAQASYSHPYTTLNPLEFLRAMAYFQPHSLPIEIMVAMLRRSHVAQWSNFYVLARTLFPKDRRLITVLENYNLWHVRISIERLRDLGTCPNVLLQAARDHHALFRRYVNRVQPGRCIVCEADIDRDALLSPLRLGQFYMTQCCAYFAHFDCWLSVSQDDYTCRICGKHYISGYMSALPAPRVPSPRVFGTYACRLTSYRS